MKYYKQRTGYTCGIACARMVLHAVGRKTSRDKLIWMMKPTRKTGTHNHMFPRVAEKLKLSYVVVRNSSWQDLRKAFNSGFVIIVCYWLEDDKTGHYAVLKKINKNDIVLMDPWYGPEHKVSRAWFLKNWHGTQEMRWFFGVKS